MSVMTPSDFNPTLTQEQANATGRWSRHLGVMPDWLRGTGRESEFQGYANADDPNLFGQKRDEYVASQRAAGAAGGYRVDEGDANVLARMGSPRDSALQQTSQAYNAGGSQVSPFTSGLRDILMQQLGVYSKAPTVNDPGIAENLAGQRLALQRSAERQQAQGAEARTTMGLSDSGFADSSRAGIEQARGEAEARGIGDVLGGELQNRRQILMQLLNSALASGDSESARALQMQLATMNQGLAQDQLAFNYADLNARNNLNTLLALLNAA